MAEAEHTMGRIQWTPQINIGNAMTLAILLGGFIYGYGQLNNKIENLDAYRIERARQTDSKFAEINGLLKDLPNMAYRITVQEQALKATNDRVDNSMATISTRLAEINQGLGSLSTQVAVLTQRLENNDGRRASLSGGR